MRRFLLLLTVAALAATSCTPGKEGEGAPNGNEGQDASPTDIRPRSKAEWSAFEAIDEFAPPPKVAKDKFDRVHSEMTLRELAGLLGRGWMRRYTEGCGIITWVCEDGRQLQVAPTTYGPEEVIDAGPRGVGGSGGRGRMWMTRLGEDRELQDLPIPPK